MCVEGKRKLMSDHSPAKPSQQLLSCLPTMNMFFHQQNQQNIFAGCDVQSHIAKHCGNFLKEKCRKSSTCAALQAMMMWLELKDVQSEGLVKVFVYFTHNHGSTGFDAWGEIHLKVNIKALALPFPPL